MMFYKLFLFFVLPMVYVCVEMADFFIDFGAPTLHTPPTFPRIDGPIKMCVCVHKTTLESPQFHMQTTFGLRHVDCGLLNRVMRQFSHISISF